MISKIVLILTISINIFAATNNISIERDKIKDNCEHQQFKCIYQCEDEDENIHLVNCYKSCDKEYLSCIGDESNVSDVKNGRDTKN